MNEKDIQKIYAIFFVAPLAMFLQTNLFRRRCLKNCGQSDAGQQQITIPHLSTLCSGELKNKPTIFIYKYIILYSVFYYKTGTNQNHTKLTIYIEYYFQKIMFVHLHLSSTSSNTTPIFFHLQKHNITLY